MFSTQILAKRPADFLQSARYVRVHSQYSDGRETELLEANGRISA